MDKLKYLLNLVIVVLLMATVAVNRDSKLFGTPTDKLFEKQENGQKVEPITMADNGVEVINSGAIVKGVVGYGGETPLKIFVREGKIEKVEILENSETPSFQEIALGGGLLEKWNGMNLSEAATAKIDGVSGATMSSVAIIKNVQGAAAYVAAIEHTHNDATWLSLKNIIAILVIGFGVAMNFIKTKKKWMKIALNIANVGVLGIWCGSFLSLSQFTAWAANGINFSGALITALLLLSTITLPFFNKKGGYCAYHCPMGAAQELVGRCTKSKIAIKPEIAKILNSLRQVILATLLFLMWIGVGFSLMDYEVFSIFIFSAASTPIILLGAIFLVLSLFTPRPYCRFICPTGALITISQKTK